jgi:ParB family transcriptional regulator, chromosome partitioning protein
MNIDRKSRMSRSIQSVNNLMDERFSAAVETMKKHPEGLLKEVSEEERIGQTIETEIEIQQTANSNAVISLPISHVIDNPYNARQIYDENIIRQRAASIATHGQQEPAKVVACDDKPGFYYLMDGHYRKKALLAAGKNEILCLVKKINTPLDLYKFSFLLNEERSQQFALDNALAWKNLIDGNLISNDDIADLVGISKATVSKTLSFLTLPDPVIQKMQEHPNLFGTTVGYEIVLIHRVQKNNDETFKIVEKVITDGISRRDLQVLREKLESNTVRKPRDISRQHKIIIEKKNVGKLKEWDDGRLLLDIRIDDEEGRAKITEQLRAMFNVNK